MHRSRSSWSDRLRSYDVVLDGREVARLKNGASASPEVAAGQHEIEAKIDWVSSNRVSLDLSDEDAVHLAVGNDVDWGKGVWGTWRAIWRTLATKQDSYLKLEPIDPPRS